MTCKSIGRGISATIIFYRTDHGVWFARNTKLLAFFGDCTWAQINKASKQIKTKQISFTETRAQQTRENIVRVFVVVTIITLCSLVCVMHWSASITCNLNFTECVTLHITKLCVAKWISCSFYKYMYMLVCVYIYFLFIHIFTIGPAVSLGRHQCDTFRVSGSYKLICQYAYIVFGCNNICIYLTTNKACYKHSKNVTSTFLKD